MSYLVYAGVVGSLMSVVAALTVLRSQRMVHQAVRDGAALSKLTIRYLPLPQVVIEWYPPPAAIPTQAGVTSTGQRAVSHSSNASAGIGLAKW